MNKFTSLALLIFFTTLAGAQHEESFRAILDEYYASQNVPGIIASVRFSNDVEWQAATGFSHDTTPMDTSLYVGVASNTKLFTSILSLKLIEQGIYNLEDSIEKWLPPIQFVDPSITVKQLLQHNGGVNDFIGNQDLFPGLVLSDPERIWTPEETLEYIFEPLGEPGEAVYYSNANYLLAAMIIEAATGLKYEDLVRDSILIPLGLDDIFLEGFEEIPGEMAHPFLFGNDLAETDRTALGTITWAAGCMVTRPISLTRWYDVVFNSDYLSDFIKEEITDFIPWPDDPEGKEMGLGLYYLNINERIYYGHGGGTVGYASYTLYDTECGHTISVAINELFTRPLDLAVMLAEKACELSSSAEDIRYANVAVFPNPASSFIQITSASNLKLYDLSGALVASEKGERMEVSYLAAGVYIVKAELNKTSIIRKVVITN